MPASSVVGDALDVADPANNDYYTRQGSPARDSAAALPSGVADPQTYGDDTRGTEPDRLAESDIGFRESCF